MTLPFAISILIVGFVATVTAPAGPPLLAGVVVLAAGAAWVANLVADRLLS